MNNFSPEGNNSATSDSITLSHLENAGIRNEHQGYNTQIPVSATRLGTDPRDAELRSRYGQSTAPDHTNVRLRPYSSEEGFAPYVDPRSIPVLEEELIATQPVESTPKDETRTPVPVFANTPVASLQRVLELRARTSELQKRP